MAQAASSEPAADSSAYAEAEKILFTTQHLGSLPPGALTYSFTQEGPASWRDSVRVAKPANGPLDTSCLTGLRFLSHINSMQSSIAGNPVLLCFLESEIRIMKDVTGAGTIFFQNNIRRALANGATISPITITWQGRNFPAQSIVISPYSDNKNIPRMGPRARITYTFVLSDAIPGRVFRISAIVPKNNSNRPWEERTVTLIDFVPDKIQ